MRVIRRQKAVGRIYEDKENTHRKENIDADKDEFGRLERNLDEKE